MKAAMAPDPCVRPLDVVQNRVAKRLADYVIAVLALLLASPVMAIAAILVRMSGPGPVIHRRRVVGVNGVQFDAFKFRTMVVDAERVLLADPALSNAFEANYKLKSDPRVTAIGKVLRKFSIDELPQFANVLAGQMSVIGPRMLSPEEVSRFGGHAATVLSVRPGLTGLWQVSGRQETTYERRIQLDVYYVQHWSPRLDIRILLRTPVAVFKGTGAF
jgi:lipopolysaccharide/colanic/teichoic acid biosynthesis glycosyltransferase